MSKTKGAKEDHDTLHVGLLVDESGSMSGNEPAVVGGINEFVAKLAADQNGTKVLATLGMFDLHGNDPVVRVKFESTSRSPRSTRSAPTTTRRAARRRSTTRSCKTIARWTSGSRRATGRCS